MRWSCPHCGIRSALPDDKVGSDWEFSRCYSCGGYAMIRRPEVDLIKIDRVPPGQRVLLPEESETTTLSAQAAERLEVLKRSLNHEPPTQGDASQVEAQRVLPELNFRGSRWLSKNVLTGGIIASSFFAFASGVYFFMAGQELLHKSVSVASAPQVSQSSQAPVSDALESRAMAPLRAVDESQSENQNGLGATGFMVRPRAKGIVMRSGPGLNYPALGNADTESFYYVTDWSDRWFKVSVSGVSKAGVSEAWVHNKEVELIGRAQPQSK